MGETVTEAQVASAVRADAPPAIVLEGVNKWFGALHVLRDINLQIATGERVVSAARPGPASPP